MTLDPWKPKEFVQSIAKVLGITIGILIGNYLYPLIFDSAGPSSMSNPTESPGRLYYTDNGGLVQEITKIYTDGNGEVIKQEVLYEYVGRLPEGKTIMLRSQDSPYTTNMVNDSSVPGVARRK